MSNGNGDDNSIHGRLKQFEASLDPHVTKFQPKVATDTDTISSTIAAIREHAERVVKMCDAADKIIAESQGDARAAADTLLHLIARVK